MRTANTKITAATTEFICTSDDTDQGDASSLNALTPVSNATNKMVGQGTDDKVILPHGLQLLQVSPKWMKNAIDSSQATNDIEQMAILSRLPLALQTFILECISDYYKADSAAEDKCITPPPSISTWTQLITQGYQDKQKGLDQQITKINKKITSLEMPGVGSSRLMDMNSNDAVKLTKEINSEQINNLNDEKATCAHALAALQKINPQDIIKGLKDKIIEALDPSRAEDLRNGYLYVFLQSPDSKEQGAGAFSQARVFKEYKVTNTAYGWVYGDIDLLTEAGHDTRTEITAAVNHVEIPALYVNKDQSQVPVKTSVLFSGEQLSWPRLATLGGIDSADMRYKIANLQGNKVLSQMVSKNDPSLLSQHSQALDSNLLKAT